MTGMWLTRHVTYLCNAYMLLASKPQMEEHMSTEAFVDARGPLGISIPPEPASNQTLLNPTDPVVTDWEVITSFAPYTQ